MIVIGNTLVLMAIVVSGKRRSRMNVFIINLACAGKKSAINISPKMETFQGPRVQLLSLYSVTLVPNLITEAKLRLLTETFI